MKPNEPDEPGSSDYNERLWRRSRNERIIIETQPLKDEAGSGRWDTYMALMNNSTQPAKLCFHQFEDHLAVADDRDTISYVLPVPFFFFLSFFFLEDFPNFQLVYGIGSIMLTSVASPTATHLDLRSTKFAS